MRSERARVRCTRTSRGTRHLRAGALGGARAVTRDRPLLALELRRFCAAINIKRWIARGGGSEAPLQSTKRPLRAFLTPPEPYHTAGCADRRRWSPVRTGDAPAARAPPARRPVRCRARGSGTRSTRSSRSHRSCRRGSRSRCAGLPTRAASGWLRTVRAGRPPRPAAGRGPRRGRRRRHGGRGRGRGLRGRGWRPMRSWYPGAGSTTRCRLPEAGGKQTNSPVERRVASSRKRWVTTQSRSQPFGSAARHQERPLEPLVRFLCTSSSARSISIRKARLTAAESRNTRATSGSSNTTFVSSRYAL